MQNDLRNNTWPTICFLRASKHTALFEKTWKRGSKGNLAMQHQLAPTYTGDDLVFQLQAMYDVILKNCW